MTRTKLNRIWIIFVCLLTQAAISGLLSAGHASAATFFTKTTVAPLNMTASATTAIAVDFTTSATGTNTAATITLVWSSGGVGSPTGFATTLGTACNTAAYFGASATVLPTTGPTVSGSSNTITLSGVNALTASTQYCFFVGTTVGATNPTSGTYTVVVTDTAAGGDTATVGVDYIANDQVVVSATVPPQFTLALSSNTDSMGNLLIGSAVYSAGVTATINTNASNGWLMWAEDTNAGLKSATAGNHLIATVACGANFNFSTGTGAEHYGLAVSSLTTGTANANYAYNAGTTGGCLTSPSSVPTAGYNQIASATVPVSADAVVVKEAADISATTPAASDYTDTVTLVGAGSF